MFPYIPERFQQPNPHKLGRDPGLTGTHSPDKQSHFICNEEEFPFDDRCTSGTHLLGRALSHDRSGELTQQAFPTSRKMFIAFSLFIHILKEMNAVGSFL